MSSSFANYSEDQLWDLLGQARQMPYGAAQIALVEQVVTHADAGRLDELAFAARMQATTSYVYGGEPARSFVTFSWCLAEFDRDPTARQRHHWTLLWHFKYMMNAMTRFPEIPLDRAYAVLDDMERRWREAGHTQHAVFAYRHHVARHVGDLDAAEEYYGRWCAAPRDDLSDCIGCDPAEKISWLGLRGRNEEAVALAEPVLGGQLTCSEQPQGILTGLLKPYLHTRRFEQARDAHRRAYRLLRPNLADLGDIAEHVEFCARTGNEARGVELLERHLGWLDRAPSPSAAMWFAAAGALVLRRAESTSDGLVVRRPAHGDRVAAEVAAATLGAELEATALAIAGRFDARNGTDYQSRSVRRTLDAEPLVVSLPLSPTVRRPAAPPRVPVPAVAEAPVRRFEAPATASPDELLDLAEELSRSYRNDDAEATWRAFDERHDERSLTPHQAARRTDARAGRLAGADQLAEAERVWRTAEDLYVQAGDEIGRQSVLAKIGQVLCETDRAEQGLPMVRAAAEYVAAHGPIERRANVLGRLAACLGHLGQPDEAFAVLDRAEAFAADSPPRAAVGLAVERMWLLLRAGRPDEVRPLAEPAVAAARAAGIPSLAGRVYGLLGQALQAAGDLPGAADAVTRAIALIDDPQLAVQLRMTRATLLARTDRAGEVLDDLVEAVAARTAAGDGLGAAQARHPLAIAYLNLDRPLDAAEVAEEELGYLTGHPGAADPTPVRYLLATVYQRLGQPNEAIAALEVIAADCVESGNRLGYAQMAEEIGDILDRLNRDAAAAARYLEAAQAYHDVGRPLEELRNRRRHAIGLHWAQLGGDAVAALAGADGLAASLPAEHGGQLIWERALLDHDGARILWGAERHAEAADRAVASAAGFRTIEAARQAVAADVLLAEILLDDSQPAAAETAVRRALAQAGEGERRQRMVAVLAAALRAQDRLAEAASCWAEFGLTRPTGQE